MVDERRRRIAVATGSRADYGLLRPTIARLEQHPALVVQLMVTGAHLSGQYGRTLAAIEQDGIATSARVQLSLDDNSRLGAARATGEAINGFADALTSLQPDLMLLLGDRYEILGAATAAMLLGVPIAHIHGGEVTEGAFDDAIRHAISKMAHLHFVAAEPYRRRLMLMGERPNRVFTVGAPGLDAFANQPKLSTVELLSEFGLGAFERFFLVTLHPETSPTARNASMVQAMLDALDGFPDHAVLFTGVNADPESMEIDAAVKTYVAKHPNRSRWNASLGSQRYGQALRVADAVIGNSSSGIIEAPAFKTPTVNIGDRQKGRLRAISILDAPIDVASIRGCITQALEPSFRSSYDQVEPPYGRDGASERIVAHLANADWHGLQLPKGFHDLE